MSTFYLLPSRPELGARFADYLKDVFPGLEWNSPIWNELAESLGAMANCRADVFVVYRDELPTDEDTTNSLTEAFGALAGDEVIEVSPDTKSVALRARRWRIGAA